MNILAIETSCDETAAAVVTLSTSGWVEVVSHVVASSEALHTQTGGIVPEVAAREQLGAITPTINKTINQAELTWAEIDAIAVTQGPGLIGSLLVGVETAKTVALALDKPLLPINHLIGHIYANWLESDDQPSTPPDFPTLALIVSGGHTELILLNGYRDYELIGGTRDDAAGECFDKCARALGLPYPGGPNIARLANELDSSVKSPLEPLPRPLLHDDTFDVSFSGLKAAFVRQVERLKGQERLDLEYQRHLAADLQQAIVDSLQKKVSQAIEAYQPKAFLLAGGVAANRFLRHQLESTCQELSVPFYKPEQKYCVDNAAMIGAAALFVGQQVPPLQVSANPSLAL